MARLHRKDTFSIFAEHQPNNLRMLKPLRQAYAKSMQNAHIAVLLCIYCYTIVHAYNHARVKTIIKR